MEINIHSIIEGMKNSTDDYVYAWNKKTGKRILVPRSSQDEIFPGLILFPGEEDFDEEQIVYNFIEEIEDSIMKKKLIASIHPPGIKKKFEDAVYILGIEKRWEQYRNSVLREVATRWCVQNKIKYIEEMGKGESDVL